MKTSTIEGFDRSDEPGAAQLAADPDLAEERDRPMFLLVRAERP